MFYDLYHVQRATGITHTIRDRRVIRIEQRISEERRLVFMCTDASVFFDMLMTLDIGVHHEYLVSETRDTIDPLDFISLTKWIDNRLRPKEELRSLTIDERERLKIVYEEYQTALDRFVEQTREIIPERRRIKVQTRTRQFDAQVEGVSDNGELMVWTAENRTIMVPVGQVLIGRQQTLHDEYLDALDVKMGINP